MGGLGFLRPAPGTWGSLPPPALAAALGLLGVGDAALHAVIAVLLVLASVACVAWGRYAETRFGRKDAAEVVADETAGVAPAVLVAVAMTDVAATDRLLALLGAFVLFRAFDVVKVWPARRLEALPAGWGVLVDDLVAGAYAAAFLAAVIAGIAAVG